MTLETYTFISPDGNPEVWEEKPGGYFTREEWDAAHPIEPPALEEAKAAKLAEINREKWAAVEGGEIEYEGLRYAADTESQDLVGKALTMNQLSGVLPPFWKAKDGLLQSPTIEQLTAIATAMYLFMENQFIKELTLAGQVAAAETVEEVAAVVWTG